MAIRSFNKKNGGCPVCSSVDGRCRYTDDSDLILCMTERSDRNGYRFIKESNNGLWGNFVPATNDRPSDDRLYQQQKAEYETKQKQRLQQQEAKLKQELPPEVRDQYYRPILNELNLSSKHEKNLLDRGLKDLSLYRSVQKFQKLENIYPTDLAGIGKDGQSLNNASEGLLVPIPQNGLIIGCQIRLDDPDDGGKYRFLSTDSKINLGGETPIGEYIPEVIKRLGLGFAEGHIKPHKASELLAQIMVGCAGGRWGYCEKQVKELLEKHYPDRNITQELYPDAGALLNRNIFLAYKKLNDFLNKLGYTLQVGEWQQHFDKSQPDIDELVNINKIKYISWEEYASQYAGPALPDENDINQLKLNSLRLNKYSSSLISEEEYLERFTLPKYQENLEDFITTVYRKSIKRRKPRLSVHHEPATNILPNHDATALARWKPVKYTLPYKVGELPTYQDWLAMGSPDFEYAAGERIIFWREANEKGYFKVLDRTPAGYGKSYDTGRLTPELLGVDGRIFYTTSGYRNPSTAGVELNYKALEGRHNGLVYNDKIKTDTGRPYLQRVERDEQCDIEPNCTRTDVFQKLHDIGIPAKGGKDEPICQTCHKLSNCTYLTERIETLNNYRLISCDLSALAGVNENDLIILEEAGREEEKAYKEVKVSVNNMLRTSAKLGDSKALEVLLPSISKLTNFLEKTDIPYHGLSHQEIVKYLPTKNELGEAIWETFFDEWLTAHNWDVPSIKEFKRHVNTLEDYTKYLNAIYSTAEIVEKIEENMVPAWLGLLIDYVNGDHRINFRVNGNKKLIITNRAWQVTNEINNAGCSIILDATANRNDIARFFRIKPNTILVAREKYKDYSNLTITIVEGMGNCGSQRQPTMTKRIESLNNTLISHHGGKENVGIIGWKKNGDDHYWFNHNRGFNGFKDKKALIGIGQPIPNLSAMASQYHVATGKLADPTDLSGEYGDFVQHKVNGEIIQVDARLRSHLRPEEELNIYLVNDRFAQNTVDEMVANYPGSKIKIVDVYDICPESASKGVQKGKAIAAAIWEAVRNREKLTIKTLAARLNTCRSNISMTMQRQFKMTFLKAMRAMRIIYNSIFVERKSIEDLTDDQRSMIRYLLDNFEDYQKQETSLEVVIADTINIASNYKYQEAVNMIATLNILDRWKLLGIFLCMVGKKELDKLLEQATSYGWLSPPEPMPTG